jgi:hypothetical protein
MGMPPLKEAYGRQEEDAIGDHGDGVALCHSLFIVNKEGSATGSPAHQAAPAGGNNWM